MIDPTSIDAICDTIADVNFDRTDLDEAEYRLLVEHIGRVECQLAAAKHQLRDAERDRAQLASEIGVVKAKLKASEDKVETTEAKARAAARCLIAATAADFDEEPTVELVAPWLQTLRNCGAMS